jgi:hypothetical protein
MQALKKFLCGLALLTTSLAACASDDTRRYYVTDISTHFYGDVVPISIQQIEASRRDGFSRPADEDPAGNWGPATQGFRLSIRLEKQTFTNGEPIVAFVLLRNVSDQHLRFPVFSERDTQGMLVLRSPDGQVSQRGQQPGASFRERASAARRGRILDWPSPVGTQRKFILDIARTFNVTNGHYTATATRKVPDLQGTGFTNLVSGPVSFSVVSGVGSIVPAPSRRQTRTPTTGD